MDLRLNLVSSRLICDQLHQLSAYPKKAYLLLLHEKSRGWNWKNSGEIVEKPHFAFSFTVILALIGLPTMPLQSWNDL